MAVNKFSVELTHQAVLLSNNVESTNNEQEGRQQVQAFRVGHTLAYTEEHGKRQALDNALNAWSPSKDYAAYCDAIAKAVEKSAVEVQDTLFGGIL